MNEAYEKERELRAQGVVEGRVLARVVDLKGFGGATRSGEALLMTEQRIFGSVLGSVTTKRLYDSFLDSSHNGHRGEVVEMGVGDEDATSSGMACGGIARLLLQDARDLPEEMFKLLNSRTPFAAVTPLSTDGNIHTTIVTRDTQDLPFPAEDVLSFSRKQILGARAGINVVESPAGEVHVEVFAPASRVVVVGMGQLASKIEEFAGLLQWSVVVSGDPEILAAEIEHLGPVDGLVVLSHDHELATPLILQLLQNSPSTYVASLGSRHTQAERRARLQRAGLEEGLVESLYGPAGLDLGSVTIAETALSIVSEMQLHKTGREPQHLRDSKGRING